MEAVWSGQEGDWKQAWPQCSGPEAWARWGAGHKHCLLLSDTLTHGDSCDLYPNTQTQGGSEGARHVILNLHFCSSSVSAVSNGGGM